MEGTWFPFSTYNRSRAQGSLVVGIDRLTSTLQRTRLLGLQSSIPLRRNLCPRKTECSQNDVVRSNSLRGTPELSLVHSRRCRLRLGREIVCLRAGHYTFQEKHNCVVITENCCCLPRGVAVVFTRPQYGI